MVELAGLCSALAWLRAQGLINTTHESLLVQLCEHCIPESVATVHVTQIPNLEP